MKSEAQVRQAFAAQLLESGGVSPTGRVPNKAERWKAYVDGLIAAGEAPASATAWKCPKSVRAAAKPKADGAAASAVDRGLMILPVMYQGKRTAISMDIELWRILAKLAGGEDKARRWIAEEARLLEGLANTTTGVESAKGAGLSRLVQRRVFELIGQRIGVTK